ncbi:MAG: hypothetical protein LWW83_15020 [Azonexaceae bacterium]|nr:hypothetical protein [Azonexaceae bacterium]
MHLFVDISAHGFGHLAITAPVLNALAKIVPDLRLTVRSGLPASRLHERIAPAFAHLPEASDFGFAMLDATRIDLPASAAAYRSAHADWPARIAGEAALLARLAPDLVLSNVSPLPLAGARVAGIPALALCSLNWADLFLHVFGDEPWATGIHRQLLTAYAEADVFLRTTPAMPMPDLPRQRDIGVIATLGQRRTLVSADGRHTALVALGGIAHRLPIEAWPRDIGWRWLVPAAWRCTHPDALDSESLGLSFTDLLCSVDAVITKPGYGTFTEAACNGVPVLYQRREDWPEQACLIDWLQRNGNCREVAVDRMLGGNFTGDLACLLAQPRRPPPCADGAARAAAAVLEYAGRKPLTTAANRNA